ncbi:hypothetical protein V490_00071 [Pseudogymnoascus sp. VKM F-3557]|nr:hypothetical protein V490_00071 [Pseudogymnoascus sp. VKM F-3557]
MNHDCLSTQCPNEKFKEIIGELASMMGHFAAALLQISHPKVANVLIAHSSVTKDPVKRGRRSLVYIFCMVFGTEEERDYILAMTQNAHDNVASKNPEVDDPELQLWIIATIYWSSVTSYENVYGSLNDKEAEAIYQQFSILGSRLKVQWPKDLLAFKVYWEKTISSFTSTGVSVEAQALAKFILWPNGLFPKAIPMWLFMHIFGHGVKIITTEMLPESVRISFGMPSTKYTRIAYRIIMRFTRKIYPLLPRRLRQIVKDFYMSNMRERMEGGRRW